MRLLLLALLAACGSAPEEPASSAPESAASRSAAAAPASARPLVASLDFPCDAGPPADLEELYPPNVIDVAESYYVEELGGLITRFQTVMFDKYSLALFTEGYGKRGGLSAVRTVYDPGTGTGALGLAALAFGAGRVVATELDPVALRNAEYNAKALGLADRFEGRLVTWDDTGAFAKAKPDERFDLIVCDPPQGYRTWQKRAFPEVDVPMEKPKEAFYTSDPGACFLRSLIEGLDAHLEPDGALLIALKTTEGKKLLQKLVLRHGLAVSELYTPDPTAREGKRLLGDPSRTPDLSVNKTLYEVRRPR